MSYKCPRKKNHDEGWSGKLITTFDCLQIKTRVKVIVEKQRRRLLPVIKTISRDIVNQSIKYDICQFIIGSAQANTVKWRGKVTRVRTFSWPHHGINSRWKMRFFLQVDWKYH